MSQPPVAKQLLFLVRSPPYAGQRALEMLDSVLVGAVFEQQVSVLFVDDGLWQLIATQTPEPRGLQNLAKQWRVLPEYDVSAVFVCGPSLAQRGLHANDLCLPVTTLTLVQQQSLIASADVVFND